MTNDGLDLIGSATWEQVKDIWRQDEDTDGFRREYTEEGYPDWESWRNIIIKPLHLDSLDWKIYNVKEPLALVPSFHGGPFKPWEDSYYGGKTTPTFAEIVRTNGTDVLIRDKFAEIIAAPKPMTLMGIVKDSEVYIVEGMHRCTALALAALRGQNLGVPVRIFLAESDLAEFKTICP